MWPRASVPGAPGLAGGGREEAVYGGGDARRRSFVKGTDGRRGREGRVVHAYTERLRMYVNIYMCVCIYMYICAYIYICIYVYIYLYIYIYIYVYMHVYMYIYIYIYVCECVCVCVCVCVYVCVCVCVYSTFLNRNLVDFTSFAA